MDEETYGSGTITVKSEKNAPVYTDEVTKAERYQADLARQLYCNIDFNGAKMSNENYAKITIQRAKDFWKKLPDEWKKAITGES